ncbi:MAG: lipocalin family protein [Firmicutes bacterium]|nr:lipocalin family protein [Bacillota bacterium]
MKRSAKILLSVLLILSILSCLAACGSKEPSGTYNLVSMEMDGETIDADTLKEFGMEVTITFNSDGTGSIDMADEKEEFEWKGNKIIADGEEISFQLDGNKLTLKQDGETMVFSK